MKNIISLFIIPFLLFSCTEKSKVESKVAEIPLEIEVNRFDKAFFETPISKLSLLKQKYPAFFPTNTPDSVWIDKMSNTLWRELYSEVQKKHGDFNVKKDEIEDLFRHIKYYYPKTKIPKVITLIQEMDPEYKVIYADSLVLVSLEMYLGKNHKFYEFPEYQKKNFEPSQILPDIVQDFSIRKVKPPVQKDLLSLMIYAGKQLYLKDVLLPEYSDEDKIGYTAEEIAYCNENDTNMWRFFIEENLLYDTNPKLMGRFIAQAPFSKFGLISDNDTPGGVGSWFGWQIVRSFMENNDISMQQMMLMDASPIFQKSKYKPTK